MQPPRAFCDADLLFADVNQPFSQTHGGPVAWLLIRGRATRGSSEGRRVAPMSSLIAKIRKWLRLDKTS
jgi:hypothetical protein